MASPNTGCRFEAFTANAINSQMDCRHLSHQNHPPASRAYLYLLAFRPSFLPRTYQWLSPLVSPQPESLAAGLRRWRPPSFLAALLAGDITALSRRSRAGIRLRRPGKSGTADRFDRSPAYGLGDRS